MPQSWHMTKRKILSDSLSSFVICALMMLVSATTLHAYPLGAQLEREIPLLMERHGVAGVNALILREGREVWAESFGMADPEAAIAMTRDRVFRVESISKPVTALGVMRLVERGEVALDDVVWEHIASWAPPSGTPEMTIRQLLSNSAGLGIGDFTARHPPGTAPSLRAALERDFEVIGTPGAAFHYSNIGFNLLEILIEDVSGQDFADFMDEAVLSPLGAGQVSFDWSPALAEKMPVGHGLQAQRIAPHVYPARASGGLLADIDDLARFVRVGIHAPHRAAEVGLPDTLLTLMHTAHVPVGGVYGVASDGYGLGHFTETLSDGRKAVWHGGQGYGWMSHVHLVPESGDAIILLTNSQRAWPLFAEVLRAWSGTLGVAPVGMARVAYIWTLGLAMTLALALGAAAQALRLAISWRRGLRQSQRPTLARSVLALGGGGLIAIVAWAAMQEYLIIDSVLPGLSLWLRLASAAAGLMLLLSAIFAPHRS